MLSNAAKETKTWLIGGRLQTPKIFPHLMIAQELSLSATGKTYTTPVQCTIPMVWYDCPSFGVEFTLPGNLVALHRKVHLFDIDIPGKITFKVRLATN
jgi:hypothetical protein